MLQKFLMVVASTLVVSHALAQRPYYNSLGPYQNSYFNWAVAPAVAVDPVAAPESSELNMLSFNPMLSELLKEGTNILNTLMPKLPYLLKNTPPTVRSDVAAVNQIIAEVCDKAMDGTQNTQTWSYYTPEGIQDTCRFINEKANEVLKAFDDPSIVDNYLGRLNIFSGNLEQKSYIQQHQSHRLIENKFE